MKPSRCFVFVTIALAVFGSIASENDSIVTPAPDRVSPPTAVSTVTSLPVTDTLAAFSVLQKKHLKTAIVTNALYAGGLGLYYGVVLPRSTRAEGTVDALKLMPLTYLSVGMMYASVPICVVSSHKAKKNYEYYYKSAPRNLTLPLTFTGAGFHIGAVGIAAWELIADYRDNHEIDQSYNKYSNLSNGLLAAGLITFAGTNLYALTYNIILGKKAKGSSTATADSAGSVSLAPMRYGDANGLLLTWNF